MEKPGRPSWTPGKAKAIRLWTPREEQWGKYNPMLTHGNEADVTLHFALWPTRPDRLDETVLCLCGISETREGRLAGDLFPLDPAAAGEVSTDCTRSSPLTYLWTEGVALRKVQVKFREPKPLYNHSNAIRICFNDI